MKIENFKVVMDDGTVYDMDGGDAYCTIGLSQKGEIGFGWDVTADKFDDHAGIFGKHRAEFADYMIALWMAWRDERSPAAGDTGSPTATPTKEK